jgi:tetratricopeptide (TPR) repeat protein
MDDSQPAVGLALEDLLQALATNSSTAEACEALADQLMVLGYGAQAARWRSWSLLPPSSSKLHQAIEATRQLVLPLAPQPPSPAAPKPGANNSNVIELTEQILKQAQHLLDRGLPEQVRDLLEGLAQASSLPPAVCNRVGMLEAHLGDHWQAERWYRTSLQHQLAQPQVWFALTRLLLNQGSWDEAIEAVGQGLSFSPRHPWGLKLRLQALQVSKGWRSLALLGSHGELPPADQCHGPLAPNRSPHPLEAPAALSLDQRLLVHRLLAERAPCWWLVNFRQGALLHWVFQQELLPPELSLQLLASRDPVGLRADLTNLPCTVAAEAPAYAMGQAAAAPGLVLLARGPLPALPRVLGRWLTGGSTPLLAPIGLVNSPVGLRVVLRHGGWDLWWPCSADA